ncbi:MAG: hypothetical protein U5O39_19235 [Gammaproteobacteria bacterium]|nr:hypothetical protein [Gammaproteobacteria bacterium]
MDRRDFLKVFSAGSVAAMGGQLLLRSGNTPMTPPVVYEDIPVDPIEIANSMRYMTTPAPDSSTYLEAFRRARIAKNVNTDDLDSYLEKMQNFESEHVDDVFLGQDRYDTLISAFKRMDRVQNLVGHGNFNVLSFDDMLNYASRYESVGAFPVSEKDFLEAGSRAGQ